MFSTKYNINLIDSKWNRIKMNIKFHSIPRADEFIYLTDRYYRVINVVHNYTKKHEIFVVVEELAQQEIVIDEKK